MQEINSPAIRWSCPARTWGFLLFLAAAVLAGILLLTAPVSAQEGGPPPNFTPVATPEAPPSLDAAGDVQIAIAPIVTRIPAGQFPNGIILNSSTRTAYVVNSTSSNVSVLDISADKHLRNMWAGQNLYWGIALKPGADRLYVADNAKGQVLEIEEANGSIVQTISLGPVLPEGIAINAGLNKAYVAHSGNLVSVIDLSTNRVIKQIDTGYYNHMIAVNEVTDRVYVTRTEYNRVTVINGATDAYLTSVLVGSNPWGVAVNSKTNLIYVANTGSNTVSVINGATNAVIKTIAVQSRPVGIAVNEAANRVYVANEYSYSLSIIDAGINEVVETVSSVGVQPVGVAANPRTGKVYVTNAGGGNVTVIQDPAAVPQPSTLTPIIIVPGYYASYNAHRMNPAPNNLEDTWEWWPLPDTCWWDIDRARCTYQPLLDALEEAGYESDPNSPNQNLFVAYYNWLRPNGESAQNDLAPVISRALTKTGVAKVHVITHSNGGLVARSWIQNHAASTVIDQLIMIAPPNNGVARVYPAWASGDISREGWKLRNFVFDFLLKARGVPMDCTVICRYTEPIYYSFMHNYITSARDLIPVYNFMLRKDGQILPYQNMRPDNQNLFLADLNRDVQNRLINRVDHVTIIGGIGERTHNMYIYEDCPNCSPYWSDGKVTADIQADGDGTVLSSKVSLPGINPIMTNAEHLELVERAIPVVLDILGLPASSPLQTSATTSSSPPADTLIYTVVRKINTSTSGNTEAASEDEAVATIYSVPVHLLITDPLGRKLGYQSNGTFINQIPYAAYYGKGDEPKLIFIPNPVEGTYRTQVIGQKTGTFGITINTQRLEGATVINGNTAAGQVTTHDFTYKKPLETFLPMIIKN